MNKIAKIQRQKLYARAADLLQQDLNRDQTMAQLQKEGISRDRARHAVAKVRMRKNLYER